VKFHSSPKKAGQFIARNVIPKEEDINFFSRNI